MCGIAGAFGKVDGQTVRRMTAAQSHRGPDDSGIWVDEVRGVALGHARLAILDCSGAGHQPMADPSGRYIVAYNGEIYNFARLRDELRSNGHAFQSRSDTEVLLAAYAQWGLDCLRRFEGMFAFALWDRAPSAGQPELILARDRFGIKPLLYVDDGNTTWFASELKALLATGRVDRQIDHHSLVDYLAYGSAMQPRTFVRGVTSLPAGHLLQIRRTERILSRYWDLHEATAHARLELQGVDEASARTRLRGLLEDAARAHLVADVPVGAFLSGGIDSTAVVGLMTRASGRPVKTVSVGFETGFEAIDERSFARLAADHFEADHEEVIVRGGDVEEAFDDIVRSIDQPSLDGVNTWFVARAARKRVKVALSGLGGDELFGGYPHFAMLSEPYPAASSMRTHLLRWLAEHAQTIRPNRFAFREMLRNSPFERRIALLRRIMSDDELVNGLRRPWRDLSSNLESRFEGLFRPDADPVQQTSYAEVRCYLQSTLLRDADVMSMAHGLEVRPMLLHRPLAEFAYALPARLKASGGAFKRIFVAAVSDIMPSSLLSRPKMGFALPLAAWMAGPLRDRVQVCFESPAARDIFEPGKLRMLRKQLATGRPPTALWAWTVLLSWMEAGKVRL